MSIQRNTDERPLDTFESALLGQLTAVVDERATQAATSPSRRLTSRPARWSAAVAAAAAGTVALLVLPGGATPAYAVDTDSSGSVTIRINQLAAALAEGRQVRIRRVVDARHRCEARWVPVEIVVTHVETRPGIWHERHEAQEVGAEALGERERVAARYA